MKKTWNSIKSACAVAGLATAMLMPQGTASASVIDAPHNDSHGVSCGACHAYSLWWQYSPAAASTSPSYSTIADAVCDKCHGLGGSEFRKVSHSADSMGAMHNTALGNWSTKCVDCHNPHLQSQLDWLPANPALGTLADGLYLVEGTITNIASNGDGTSTITFTNAAAKASWEDALRWNNKSGNVGRGLILSLRYKAGYKTYEQTYEIVDATATTPVSTTFPGSGEGTITIQNGSATVPSNYNNTNFGIIYGQLVKSSIKTPNSGTKSVKFFDSGDGMVDSASGASTKAICQVCHTQTTYWRNDGSLATHNDGARCTTCHPIAAGFKPSYPDHNAFIAKLTSCGTCHTGAKVVEDIHHFNCSICHAASGPPALKEANPATPFRQTPTAWTPINSPPALGDCGQCHGSDYFDYHKNKANHTGQVDKTVTNCTSACHFHDKADTVADIHKNNCSHCHDLANGGVKISLAAQYGPGNCTNCHRTIASNWRLGHPKANDHSGQVDQDLAGGFIGTIDGRSVTRPDCSTVECHTGSTDFDVHWSRACSTCHAQYTGALYGGALKGPGTCSTCHTEIKYDAVNSASPRHTAPTP